MASYRRGYGTYFVNYILPKSIFRPCLKMNDWGSVYRTECNDKAFHMCKLACCKYYKYFSFLKVISKTINLARSSYIFFTNKSDNKFSSLAEREYVCNGAPPDTPANSYRQSGDNKKIT